MRAWDLRWVLVVVVGCNVGSQSSSSTAGTSSSASSGSASAGSSGSTGAASSSSSGGLTDAGSPLVISPSSARVLACGSASFTATLPGMPDVAVTWSVAPPDAGAIDGGAFEAAAVSNVHATVTAVAASSSATAAVLVDTAFPSAPAPIDPTHRLGGGLYIFQHDLASQGDRVYATFVTTPPDGGGDEVLLVRSDDGGAGWGPPLSVTGPSASFLDCATVAVDPVDPDVVYVAYYADAMSAAVGFGLPSPTPTTATTAVVLATSLNAGATFSTHWLIAGYTAFEGRGVGESECPDLIAPAPGTVAVVSPNADCGSDPTAEYFELFIDRAQGAGFDGGTSDASTGAWLSNGLSPALANETNTLWYQCGEAGTRAFTDGQGHLCVSWITAGTDDQGPSGVWATCSGDDGDTFSAPIQLDGSEPMAVQLTQVAGAFGPSGQVAVLYPRQTDAMGDGDLQSVLSGDWGATWSAPATVPTRVLGSAPADSIAVTYDASGVLWDLFGHGDDIYVNKSCDGLSWTGAVLMDSAPSTVAGEPAVKRPSLSATAGTPIAAEQFNTSNADRMLRFGLGP